LLVCGNRSVMGWWRCFVL